MKERTWKKRATRERLERRRARKRLRGHHRGHEPKWMMLQQLAALPADVRGAIISNALDLARAALLPMGPGPGPLDPGLNLFVRDRA